MITIYISTRFKRSFKKIPLKVKNDFANQIKILNKNPFHPSLKTHKLNGNLEEYYSFYLRDGFRVLFDFTNNSEILLVNIGNHDDYRKWER